MRYSNLPKSWEWSDLPSSDDFPHTGVTWCAFELHNPYTGIDKLLFIYKNTSMAAYAFLVDINSNTDELDIGTILGLEHYRCGLLKNIPSLGSIETQIEELYAKCTCIP